MQKNQKTNRNYKQKSRIVRNRLNNLTEINTFATSGYRIWNSVVTSHCVTHYGNSLCLAIEANRTDLARGVKILVNKLEKKKTP